jgi:polygalacturonase
MKILFVSPVSVTIELENNEIYFSKEKYDVLVNSKVALKDVDTNVFSLFELTPNTEYVVSVNDEKVSFKTDAVNRVYEDESLVKDGSVDMTSQIQTLINNAQENDMVVINEGTYLITSLKLKSNMTLYLKKGAELIASTNEQDFKDIEGFVTLKDGRKLECGSWEGDPWNQKESILMGVELNNVKVVGEGTLNGRANESTWWVDFRKKPYARPHMIYFIRCNEVKVQGINVKNSPQWTIHPYFCENIGFYDLYIENPKISPNTDGLNPQCCTNVEIIGVLFSVGDDCIALKSGKMAIGKKYKTPSSKITIRNCWMRFGHGAVVLGSEMSGGIKDITVERCIFDHTDRGLRIKTRRGRGDTAVIDGITFSNILMKGVLNPLTVNMFYFCDPDGKTEYVWSKEKLPVDDRTPYLGKFTFKNIKAEECEYCAGYFYGLPEQPVGEINIEDCEFSFKEDAASGTPIMMTNAEVCCKKAFTFNNVKKVNMKNVVVKGNVGPLYDVSGNEELYYG